MKFFQIHDTFNILTRNHFQIHKKIQICELFKIREIVNATKLAQYWTTVRRHVRKGQLPNRRLSID